MEVSVAHVLEAILTAILGVCGVIGVGVLVAMAIGFPIKWMMNYLFTPTVLRATFGVSQMTFWRAFWLAILISFLFSPAGIRFGPGH
jgi:hypothetical protein